MDTIHCDFCEWVYCGSDPADAYAEHWIHEHAKTCGPMVRQFASGLTTNDRKMLRNMRISTKGFEQ